MIHTLFLVDNRIRSIDDDAFRGLDGLLYLKISRNFLTAVEAPTSIDSSKLFYLQQLTWLKQS